MLQTGNYNHWWKILNIILPIVGFDLRLENDQQEVHGHEPDKPFQHEFSNGCLALVFSVQSQEL
jgi:hypothetical protein